jgi:hypothetical protein
MPESLKSMGYRESVRRQNIPYVIDEYESCGNIRIIKWKVHQSLMLSVVN